MRTVKNAEEPGQKFFDYAELAKKYNTLELGGAVVIDSGDVYNTTLFKQAIGRRGLTEGTDFVAFKKGPEFYVKRVTAKRMEG